MHKLLASITAATVLAHAILGCCAHAVQVSNCCDHGHVAGTEHAGHDDASSCGVDEPGDEQSPGSEHACCRIKCQWLAPDTPGDLVTALLSHAAIFDADQTASLCAAMFSSSEFSPHDSLPALQMRSHLALSVLLI